MSRYTDMLGEVSSSAATGSHVADIVAALTPPPRPKTLPGEQGAGAPNAPVVKYEPRASAGDAALSLVPGVAGGAVGALLWKKHRVLGFLAGNALGGSAHELYRGRGDERTRALCRLGVEGAGIGGALLWKKHPVLGWLAGVAAGAVATSFVPGSAANEQYERLRAKKGR